MALTARDSYLRRTYGITEAQYEEMLVAQNGVCAICDKPPKKRRLHVDHNHRTGRVRGLLDFRCNRWLPTWITPTWLRRAAEYLENAGE